MGLANIVTYGCKATVTEIVRIVAAQEINGTVLISSVTVVWSCSDVGITCKKETKANINAWITTKYTQKGIAKTSYVI